MKNLVICLALLGTAGCAGVPLAADGAIDPSPTPALHEGDDGVGGIQHWLPDIAADFWETFEADIGAGYGFGAHIKLTDALRLGIFDHADFNLLGIESDIFHGYYEYPFHSETWREELDAALKLGVGFGAGATLHTWEVVDLFSTIVGLGYWSLDQD